jgi:hypothetical protein
MRRTGLITIAVVLGIAAMLGYGCATKTVAPPPVDESPAASFPTGAVQRFVWGFNHKDVDVVVGLFTDDFQFITAGTDSAGNPTRNPTGGPGQDRSWFLEALAVLQDPSSEVSLAIDRYLIEFPDPRPGKDPRFHKQVGSSVDAKVLLPGSGGGVEVTGNLLFFLTRGDSAAIPAELVALGVKPDSTRWWIDRLEDETFGDGVYPGPTPTKSITFAALLGYLHSHIAR